MAAPATIRPALPEWGEWLDLKTLARYASVSTKTLQRWIKAASDPLPAAKRSGKVLVSRKGFDSWMERQQSACNPADVNAAVDKILRSL
jgi:hypothetical protein